MKHLPLMLMSSNRRFLREGVPVDDFSFARLETELPTQVLGIFMVLLFVWADEVDPMDVCAWL